MMNYTYSIYGLNISVPFPCKTLTPLAADSVPDIVVNEGSVPECLDGPVVQEQRWQALPGVFLLRGGLRSGRFLVEGGQRISLQRNPGAEDSMLAAHLLSSVTAALLRQRGMLVLHANAANTPHGAVAITGESGTGKSTTMAALLRRGCSMLSDDITALLPQDDATVRVLPGLAKLTLCDDAAEKLGHDVRSFPRNPLRRSKVVVPVRHAMATSPTPLKVIYQLRRHSGKEVVVTPLKGVEKFAAVQDCIYGPLFPQEHSGFFALFQAVTEQVEVVRIERPRSSWSLDQVIEAILHG